MKPLAAAVLLICVFAASGGACQCGSIPSVGEALLGSNLVLLGTVSRIDDPYTWWWRLKVRLGIEPELRDMEEYERVIGLRVTLSVDRVIKGSSGASVTLITGHGGGDCGYPFEVGSKYLIFVWKGRDGLLRTSICTRTKPASTAGADIAAMDAILGRR
jgi:hypothetical protein